MLEHKLRIIDHTGENLACICPFHKGGRESRPSFYVYVGPVYGTKVPGMAFCHTCNRGWSLKGLLKDLGTPLKRIDALTKDIPTVGERITPIRYAKGLTFDNPVLPEGLLGVYDSCPVDLLDAGFEMSILRKYEIGFDPFLDRITFPLRDHKGNLIGISGRSVAKFPKYRYHLYRGDDLRKAGDDDKELARACSGYKLFKGRFLWNLHSMYTTAIMGSIPYVIVVEGFKQAMWLAQAGWDYTVALMGSHMSREQATLLMRLGAPVYIFLDNDAAGQQSAPKLVKWLRRQSPDIYQVTYPVGTEDLSPDDFRPEDLSSILTIVGQQNGQVASIHQEVQQTEG